MADIAWKFQKTSAEMFSANEMQMNCNENEFTTEISATTTKKL